MGPKAPPEKASTRQLLIKLLFPGAASLRCRAKSARLLAILIGLFSVSLASMPARAIAAPQSTAPSSSHVTDGWPTQAWSTSSPEEQGFDSATLAGAFEYIRRHRTPIHSLLVERNGHIILDAYFFPFAEHQRHDLASGTKSVTATLIGALIGRGAIASPDQRILPVFGSDHNGDERWRQVTFAHLLSMTSGLACHADHGEQTLRDMQQTQHWSEFVLDLPMAAAPGQSFGYCSSGMHLLSAAITRVTGESALDFARTNVFSPLGITNVAWPADPDGVSHGWGDLQMEPRDMAKLGYLWLHGGEWNGAQIVPTSFLNAATQQHSQAPWHDRYGYGFWVHPERAPAMYEALGRGGQRISVIPEKNLVVVMTGGGYEPGEIGVFIQRALRSDSPLPPNPTAERNLAAAVSGAAAPPPPTHLIRRTDLERRLSGRVFEFARNALAIQSLSLSFGEGAEGHLAVSFEDGRIIDGAIGLDGVPRFLVDPQTCLPASLSGVWSGDSLRLSYDQIGAINAFQLSLTPRQDGVDLDISERTGLVAPMHLSGRESSAQTMSQPRIGPPPRC